MNTRGLSFARSCSTRLIHSLFVRNQTRALSTESISWVNTKQNQLDFTLAKACTNSQHEEAKKLISQGANTKNAAWLIANHEVARGNVLAVRTGLAFLGVTNKFIEERAAFWKEYYSSSSVKKKVTNKFVEEKHSSPLKSKNIFAIVDALGVKGNVIGILKSLKQLVKTGAQPDFYTIERARLRANIWRRSKPAESQDLLRYLAKNFPGATGSSINNGGTQLVYNQPRSLGK